MTNKFIKVPISLYDIKMEQLTGKINFTESYAKINPDFIMYYVPTLTEQMEDATIVYIANQPLTVMMHIEEFEKLIINEK